ncbi:MAG: FAD-dependent oxidoreductase [Clostridia bacterium]|nr:FAD-dependent oxidoreductase [Clostridia bacterium]
MYDIIIIGAGPAGLTAALYACRSDKSVLVIEKETFGGQITYSPRVENYPGFAVMSGNEFAEKLLEQVMAQGADVELDEAIGIEGSDGDFTVKGKSAEYKGKSVIIASGSKHRHLNLPNEDRFIGENISFCAVCDGAFYKGKTVAVVGGGNSALQEAVLLSDGCEKVYIVQNLGFLTGEGRLVNEVSNKNNIEIILSTVVTSINGETKFEGLGLKNTETGEETALKVDGVFVAIGQQPENEPFKTVVALDERGYISSGEDCLPSTSFKGIFTAGDCRTKQIRQITTATADGAVAAIAACRFLDTLK